MDHERFRHILVRARERTTADDYPKLPALRHETGLPAERCTGTGRRRLRCLTQVEMSLLMGRDTSATLYVRLERGQI
ncbi:hypothetical protein AB0933_22070 [Streptomyces venezuelae]|uniref:hypothetical protein n=1 Tax=Streptomyces venezuelae TaxID=54571 RepID=UPI003451F48E